MSEFQTHQPHILRPHMDEWCGGTEPPTIVSLDDSALETTVAIYENEADVHEGLITQPIDSVRYLHLSATKPNHDSVAKYAASALRHHTRNNPR